MYYGALLRAGRRVGISILVLLAVTAIDLVMFPYYHAHLDADILPVPLYAAFAVGNAIATIFAFIFAGLADENDGHLAVAWTKPASRTKVAIARFAVESAAIVVLFFIFSAAAYFVFFRIGLVHGFVLPPDWPAQLGRFIIAPVAFYGVAQAITSSLDKTAGLIRGLCAFGFYVCIQLAAEPLAQPYAAIVHAVNALLPWTYLQLGFDDAGHATAVGTIEGYIGLVIIALAGFTAAIVQWRRLEA